MALPSENPRLPINPVRCEESLKLNPFKNFIGHVKRQNVFDRTSSLHLLLQRSNFRGKIDKWLFKNFSIRIIKMQICKCTNKT